MIPQFELFKEDYRQAVRLAYRKYNANGYKGDMLLRMLIKEEIDKLETFYTLQFHNEMIRRHRELDAQRPIPRSIT